MNITIHRGLNQIGGCITEISTETSRVFIDFGQNLPGIGEKCDAYIATKNNDNALRKKTAKLWAELNNAPILLEHINCQGCRTDGVKTVFCDSLCTIRKCAISKGVETCGDCSEMATCKDLLAITANNPETKKNLKSTEDI